MPGKSRRHDWHGAAYVAPEMTVFASMLQESMLHGNCLGLGTLGLGTQGLLETTYLEVFGEHEAGQLEERCGSGWQMYEQQPVDLLSVLVDDSYVCESSGRCILHNLLQRRSLHREQPLLSGSPDLLNDCENTHVNPQESLKTHQMARKEEVKGKRTVF